jgi:hypothetical protein
MRRIRLRFESIQQVAGNQELAVILLTDEERKRVLSVVCDDTMTRQILLRLQSPQRCSTMLPESLVAMLGEDTLDMMVYGLHDGQYQVVLANGSFQRHHRIRLSDAVLLSLIAGFPLYIEEHLMNIQSTPFDEQATGISIPINTMDVTRLNLAMQKAIDEENYELASKLRDELNRRKSV